MQSSLFGLKQSEALAIDSQNKGGDFMNEDKGNILIIDDMPENLQYLSRLLNQMGYSVRALPNAKLAIQSIFTHPPDLILLDIIMPDISGFDLCKMLKEKEASKHIPILFISGKDDTESIVEGFRLGGVDYITKPFKNEEVLARVKTHMKLEMKNRELEDLLSKTLMGSMEAIMDILAFVDPDAFRKSKKVSYVMDQLIHDFSLLEPWKLKLAALLSNIGTLKVPRIQKKTNQVVESKESSKNRQIETAAMLIKQIPKLDSVAEIISGSSKMQVGDKTDFYELTNERQGSLLLMVINEVYEMYADDEGHEAVNQYILKKYKGIDKKIIWKVTEILSKDGVTQIENLMIHQLEPGMVLAENVVTSDHLKLLSEGTELSYNIIHLLKKHTLIEGVREPIKVLIS